MKSSLKRDNKIIPQNIKLLIKITKMLWYEWKKWVSMLNEIITCTEDDFSSILQIAVE